MNSLRRCRLVLVLGWCVLLAGGCRPKYPFDPSGKAPLSRLELHTSMIEVVSGAGQLWLGGSRFLDVSAYAVDEDGAYADVTTQVALTSSDTAVARPSARGYSFDPGAVVSPRTVTLGASYGQLTASYTLRVNRGDRPTPYLIPADVIWIGRSFASTRVFLISAPFRPPSVLTASEVTWASSNPHVIVAHGGDVTVVGPGVADITVSGSGLSNVYRVSVGPFSSDGIIPSPPR